MYVVLSQHASPCQESTSVNEICSFRNKRTLVIIKPRQMFKRWIHPCMGKDNSQTVTPSRSRYTLTPHEPKNGKRNSPQVGEKKKRPKNPAKPRVSDALTQGDKSQATTTTTNANFRQSNERHPEFVLAGPSNADERRVESRPEPSRFREIHSINQAIAAGAPVIIARDEAERERVMRAIQQEDEDFMEGIAARASKATNSNERQTDGDKGKGKAKQAEGDKSNSKTKQTEQDREKGNKARRKFFHRFRKSSQ